MAIKKRIDQWLVDQGFANTRAKAQALILSGSVFIKTEKVEKPGTYFSNEILSTQVTVKTAEHPFVSRGALKLKSAIQNFGISVLGKTCLDIGACAFARVFANP